MENVDKKKLEWAMEQAAGVAWAFFEKFGVQDDADFHANVSDAIYAEVVRLTAKKGKADVR